MRKPLPPKRSRRLADRLTSAVHFGLRVAPHESQNCTTVSPRGHFALARNEEVIRVRELRVIGVTPDAAHIVCEDRQNGQKFRLPADEKLRAAARGDLARFGQIEIEMEATMRPRDIQARIRAGATVEQVVHMSGMPASRIERFAYPVLLERARAAELAQKAHPLRPDGPAVELLIDVVAAAFTARGHTLDNAEWDAWKDEKGFWVAQLQWRNGHSEIAAHWRYQADSHGGTVAPLDDPASDLIDPDFGRALRGLATGGGPIAEPQPEPRRQRESPPGRPVAVPAPDYYQQRAVSGGHTPLAPTPLPTVAASARPVAPEPPKPEPEPPVHPGHTDIAGRESQGESPAERSRPEPETELPPARQSEPAKSSRTKRGKAPMPSWEDVLLGVRSSGR